MLECLLLVLAGSLFGLSFGSDNPAGMQAMSFVFVALAVVVWVFLPRVPRPNRDSRVNK